MKTKWLVTFIFAFVLGLGWSLIPSTVSATEDLIADTILVKGKVLTMDSDDPNNITIAQGVAIRGDKILAVGSDADIQALAGPTTKIIDLGGKTVIPGVIDTHYHLQTYANEHLMIPIPGTVWSRIKKKTISTIKKQTKKLQAGDFILIRVPKNGFDENGDRVGQRQGLDVTLVELDAVAPNHPVLIRRPFVVNTQMLNLVIATFGDDLGIDPNDGSGGSSARRRVMAELVIGDPRFLADLLKPEMEESARNGQTTVSIGLDGLAINSAAIIESNRRGELITRWAIKDDLFYSFGASDMVWNIGPGTSTRSSSEEAVRNGFRLAGGHIRRDTDLERVMDIIEEQSLGRFSLEEIRARRHAADHCTRNPTQAQIPRVKNLGMIMGCGPKYIRDEVPVIFRDEDPNTNTKDSVPLKSLLDAGVRTVFETDEHHELAPNVVFLNLESMVTRISADGVVYNPEEKIDRMSALLTATRWAAEYVLREDVLGSIEVGKWADLVVLDRDYQNVPEEEISEVRPVMTMVGGKIVFEANN